MSEYQSYEFRALDAPVDAAGQQAMRAVSSRGRITPHSFSNEYHWGDFKGDERKWMEQWFDVFVYFANWGTHQLILRFPGAALPPEVVAPFATEGLTCWTTDTHTLVEFLLQPDDGGDWQEDDESWIDRLLGLRDELLAGDLRPLYLAWLASASDYGTAQDEEPGPAVPPGLGKLTDAQTALADFLDLGQDLLAAAAARSPARTEQAAAGPDWAAWLAGVPVEQKDAWLVAVARGEGGVAHALRAGWRAAQPPTAATDVGPSVQALLADGEARRAERERLEAERRAAAARAKAAAETRERRRRAEVWRGREDEAWRKIDSLVAGTQPKLYQEALALLRDLHELARLESLVSEFEARVESNLTAHVRKGTWVRMVREAMT